ncbi:hypothetical protein ACLBOM_10655 [Escherichia coli]
MKIFGKQDATIPLTLIAADSMDEYNKPYLSQRHQSGANAPMTLPARRR